MTTFKQRTAKENRKAEKKMNILKLSRKMMVAAVARLIKNNCRNGD